LSESNATNKPTIGVSNNDNQKAPQKPILFLSAYFPMSHATINKTIIPQITPIQQIKCFLMEVE